jgi:hypothetical protein
MKKLKLNLDDLKVESFQTLPSMNKKGTAHGHLPPSIEEIDTCFGPSCRICPTDLTCYNTCEATCANTCPDTCANTCPATCGYSCGGGCPTEVGISCVFCPTEFETCHPCITVP